MEEVKTRHLCKWSLREINVESHSLLNILYQTSSTSHVSCSTTHGWVPVTSQRQFQRLVNYSNDTKVASSDVKIMCITHFPNVTKCISVLTTTERVEYIVYQWTSLLRIAHSGYARIGKLTLKRGLSITYGLISHLLGLALRGDRHIKTTKNVRTH